MVCRPRAGPVGGAAEWLSVTVAAGILVCVQCKQGVREDARLEADGGVCVCVFRIV